MKKRPFTTSITIITIAILCLCSCTRFSTRKMMRDMMAKPILMPDSLLKVSRDSVVKCNLSANNTLIVYIDSQECKSCVFSNLKGYDLLNKQSKSSSMFKLAIIISPAHNEREEAIALARSHIGFTAYIDVNNDFSEINKNIPRQRSFHTFLTDRQGRVIFIGDPLSSERMMELFIETLYKHK